MIYLPFLREGWYLWSHGCVMGWGLAVTPQATPGLPHPSPHPHPHPHLLRSPRAGQWRVPSPWGAQLTPVSNEENNPSFQKGWKQPPCPKMNKTHQHPRGGAKRGQGPGQPALPLQPSTKRWILCAKGNGLTSDHSISIRSQQQKFIVSAPGSAP